MCKFRVYSESFYVRTNKRFEIVRITDKVEDIVRVSGIRNGLVLVYLPHATAALIANEYEPRIVSDYIEWVRKNIPPEAPWRHNEIDSNAHAHIASAFISSSRVFPLINGELVRGTWQEILLLELDGPRNRKVLVEVLGC
ncbi:MAG: hypothetical protein B6U85_03850 [Desulfurococcales archaeon ex4484_42]|nr:MAG: hypothetical protein B6U85_03850 [Desulfurococcales archaeon ex4484_42]